MGIKELFKPKGVVVPKKVIVRIPSVGDSVWWAPKGVGGEVRSVQTNGMVSLTAGPLVKNKKGRQVPRWTVQANAKSFVWRGDLNCWILGQGPHPKVVRGEIKNPKGHQIVRPTPVQMSGQAKGSFATNTKE
jgi:hypothetical protein